MFEYPSQFAFRKIQLIFLPALENLFRPCILQVKERKRGGLDLLIRGTLVSFIPPETGVVGPLLWLVSTSEIAYSCISTSSLSPESALESEILERRFSISTCCLFRFLSGSSAILFSIIVFRSRFTTDPCVFSWSCLICFRTLLWSSINLSNSEARAESFVSSLFVLFVLLTFWKNCRICFDRRCSCTLTPWSVVAMVGILGI